MTPANTPGPYHSREQAYRDTEDIWRATRSQVRSAGRAMRRERLVDACRAAGVELGGYDDEVATWLAEFAANEAVQSIAALIRRAYASGRRTAAVAEITTSQAERLNGKEGA